MVGLTCFISCTKGPQFSVFCGISGFISIEHCLFSALFLYNYHMNETFYLSFLLYILLYLSLLLTSLSRIHSNSTPIEVKGKISSLFLSLHFILLLLQHLDIKIYSSLDFRHTMFQHWSHHQCQYPTTSIPRFTLLTSIPPPVCHLDRHLFKFGYWSLGLMISVLLTSWFGYLLCHSSIPPIYLNSLVLCTHEMEMKIKLQTYYILNACFSSISLPLLSPSFHTHTPPQNFFPFPSYILGFKGYLGII